ncbi:ubiquitin-activating enzyme E1 [Nematocida ausubeli]|nr:ubiquitin-activating enzyme E1 [Nematocida ausubeli]
MGDKEKEGKASPVLDKVFSPKIDESLYSRQIYVMGNEAMKRMLSSHVLVLGLRNAGLELVKNIVLAGIKTVSIYDPNPLQAEYLSTLFYCTESDIGDRIDKSAEYKLKELNTNVKIQILQELPSDEELRQYSAVILNDHSIAHQIQVNEVCRQHSVPFIAVQCRGLFFQIFCDFGDAFVTMDTNGEAPYIGTIKSVTPTGIVSLVEEERHFLEDGDTIQIKSKNATYTVTDTKAFTFSLERYSGEDLLGQTFEQIKQKKVISCKSLKESIAHPEIQSEDKISHLLHTCFTFEGETSSHDETINAYLQKYPTEIENVPIITEFFRQPKTTIAPIASVAGGIAAHEVLKACSSKFTPLHQFMYYSALELLPPLKSAKETEQKSHVSEGEDNASNSPAKATRYTPLLQIFGESAVQTLFKAGIFIVGAGAIGCEHIKNISMLGVGQNGSIAITDMDAIERSNLNRQFLFRPHDISNMKSVVAAREAEALNPTIHNRIIQSYTSKVGKETECIFNDEFFGKTNLILNALDNVEARLYIDNRSVYHKVAVIDSGTLGSKGHTQAIIPHVTEHYGNSNDPQEKSIPLCTIRNFPYLPVHCVEWALADFKTLFFERIIEAKRSISEAGVDALSEAACDLINNIPRSPKEAAGYAVRLFVERFIVGPMKLCESFPRDHITEEGTPFWVPPKKMPRAETLSLTDPWHMGYIRSTYDLVLRTFSVEGSMSFEGALLEYFQGKNTSSSAEEGNNPDISQIKNEDVSRVVDNLCTEMMSRADPARDTPGVDLSSIKLEEEEFEKDSEVNGHVEYVACASNIRARIYGIDTLDRLEVKRISGRIIPAIATTTAVVSGLAVIEGMKYLLHHKAEEANPEDSRLGRYRNTFVSLALPLVMSSEPIQPMKEKVPLPAGEIIVGPWDVIEMQDAPLSEIMKTLGNQWGVEIHTVMSDLTVLYCSFYNVAKFKENLDKKPSQILYPSGVPMGVQSVRVDMVVEGEDGNDLPVPFVKVLFKGQSTS